MNGAASASKSGSSLEGGLPTIQVAAKGSKPGALDRNQCWGESTERPSSRSPMGFPLSRAPNLQKQSRARARGPCFRPLAHRIPPKCDRRNHARVSRTVAGSDVPNAWQVLLHVHPGTMLGTRSRAVTAGHPSARGSTRWWCSWRPRAWSRH
jgi:hypothetical protein